METGTTSSSKRGRAEISRDTRSYPRKRALKACNTCRMRKTKCNNERPVCGFCRSLGANCVFDDANDLSTFDPASQVIIDRLDQVLEKLDQRSVEHIRGGILDVQPVSIQSNPPLAASAPPDDQNHGLIMDDNSAPVPSCRVAPDAVLDWPVFQGKYPSGYFSNPLFIKGFKGKDSVPAVRTKSSVIINEEEVPKLVERFLSRIHTRCPVLDVVTARKYASNVSQEGLRWDSESCLTLIMCALGSVAQSFSDLYTRDDTDNDISTSKSLHQASLDKGRVYYEAACKRVGLLDTSILSTQCIFLCGIFEMYNLDPIKAWRWFSNSSSTLYTYLRCQEIHSTQDITPFTQCSETQRLETSIYWSSYKSMCEIRTELLLPTSILGEVPYPYLLPIPPSNLDTGVIPINIANSYFETTPKTFSQIHEQENSDTLEEQAWFFFLTDLILARLNARVLLNLYDEDHHQWNANKLNQMLQAADIFEKHIDEWFSTLPAALKFNDADTHPNHELRFIVHYLALEIKAWIYRPFLYYTIHHVPFSLLTPHIQTLILKAIDSCVHWIRLKPAKHRHHGSWYVCRSVLASALCLLGAVKSGHLRDVDSLKDWRSVVKEAISVMRFWEDESEDFRKGREVLEEQYDQLDKAS